MINCPVYISSGESSATIDAAGAYLRRLRLNGTSILKETSDMQATHGGMALLAPYANRIRDGAYTFMGKTYHFQKNNEGNSIHGFAKNSMFQIVRRTRARLTLHSLLSDDGYPGALDLLVTFTISPEKLEIKVRAENDSVVPLPFQLGFHPYFLFDKHWTAGSSGPIMKLSNHDGYFPDGSGKFVKSNYLDSKTCGSIDNCFWVDGDFSLHLGSYTLKFKRNGFPFLQFYNGEYAQGRSVAVEPMTAPANCFNTGIGLKTILPGDFETFTLQLMLDRKDVQNQDG